MRPAILSMALWLVLAASTGSCVGGTPPAGEGHAGEPRVTLVRIVNRNWADVRFYLTRGRARSQLGVVTSGATETFAVPQEFIGTEDLRLVADPVGSILTFESDPFQVYSGQIIEWTIHNKPQHSRLWIH
ncbi:MAG TPA: hypothetical protein VM737_04060 [Gemmatimonadota bacterium]|nr:hypothetical protein [Gemmatimonadota bacterium]